MSVLTRSKSTLGYQFTN